VRKLGCLALALALIIGAWYMVRGFGGVASTDTVIVIEQGTSLRSAAKLLERQGVIKSASGFLNYARVFGAGGSIKPGEYEVKKGMSAASVLELLQSGKTLQRFVPIPEGMPSIMVYERLMAVPFLKGDIDVPAEGSILPDNYSYVRGESRASVVRRMQAAMKRTIAELWPLRKPTAVVKTPEEAVTLASIVEKETGKASERRMVAGVYSYRLTIGMKLQADPTIIYLTSRGKPIGRRILQSEIDAKNDYNTYQMLGLPIGPITNPGKKSIMAVLDPEPTRNKFFVADGTGGHIFAETDTQHLANVANWKKIRRERGEIQ
jgi:UPF0755 protein